MRRLARGIQRRWTFVFGVGSWRNVRKGEEILMGGWEEGRRGGGERD